MDGDLTVDSGKSMGLRYPFQIYGSFFFVTTTYKDWRKLGDVEGFYEALSKTLSFYLNIYDAKLIGYVFMPDHIHLLLTIEGKNLSNFMRDFKKYTG